MARTVGIGYQNYQEIIEDNAFYVDKTLFIKEWWESLDRVTLITRPRRFGKTLNMSICTPDNNQHLLSIKLDINKCGMDCFHP